MDYTKIKNCILNKIITSNLTKRQLKILLFIIKSSYGLNKKHAVLHKKDFLYAGISPYLVDNELEKLVIRGVIKWNPKKGRFWINKNLHEWINKKRKIYYFNS